MPASKGALPRGWGAAGAWSGAYVRRVGLLLLLRHCLMMMLWLLPSQTGVDGT